MRVAQALLSPSVETAVVRLFASIFISSLAAMLSWRNRCIHNVRLLQARLFALCLPWWQGGLQGQSSWGKPPGPLPSWLPKWCRQTVCKATPERWRQAPAPSTWPLLLFLSGQCVWDDLLKTTLASRTLRKLLPFIVITLHTIVLFSRANWLFG